MPSVCCVFGCQNTHKNSVGKNISFFHLPSNRNLRQIWLATCNFKSGEVHKKHARICSIHFREFDLIPQSIRGPTIGSVRKLLRPGAVPANFIAKPGEPQSMETASPESSSPSPQEAPTEQESFLSYLGISSTENVSKISSQPKVLPILQPRPKSKRISGNSTIIEDSNYGLVDAKYRKMENHLVDVQAKYDLLSAKFNDAQQELLHSRAELKVANMETEKWKAKCFFLQGKSTVMS